ncbi:hypothetical protein DND01_12870 [Escherichia albertii]|nr:hypothetical protein [Escherichia albertii]
MAGSSLTITELITSLEPAVMGYVTFLHLQIDSKLPCYIYARGCNYSFNSILLAWENFLFQATPKP